MLWVCFFLVTAFPFSLQPLCTPWHQLPKQNLAAYIDKSFKFTSSTSVCRNSQAIKNIYQFHKNTHAQKNQNTTQCYTFPQVMPASQSWQAVLAVWDGKQKGRCLKRFSSQLQNHLHLPVMLLLQAQGQVLLIFQCIDLKAGSLFYNISACQCYADMLWLGHFPSFWRQQM